MVRQVPVSSSKLPALTGTPWFWVAVVGVLFGVPLVRGLTQGRAPPPPPVLGAFPGFALRADDGSTFAPADLHGRVFIADLLCGACAQGEQRAEAMRTLQHRTRNLGDAVRLVSFSQGLEPARLRELRARSAAGQRWTMVAGAPPSGEASFSGENTLLLVDGRMRIRGRYEAQAPGEIDRLLRDAALVTAFR